MAQLTVTTTDRDGDDIQTLLTAAAAGGDSFANTGKELFIASNANASSYTVTFATQETVDGLAVSDQSITVAQNEEFIVGPFPISIYNDSSGLVQVTYSAVTDLTVCVVKIGT